jgi:hypothetical protein
VSRLLSLYPARWRERYGDELLDALSAHPLTLHGRLDVIRGAVDAHLHPELVQADGMPVPAGGYMRGPVHASRRVGIRLFLAATATAAFWTAAALVMVESRLYGGASLQGTLLLIGMVALIGVMWDRAGRSVPVGICAAAVAFTSVALIQAGWPSQDLDPGSELLVLYLVAAVGGLGVCAALLSRSARTWSVWQPMVLTTMLGACYLLGFTRGISLTLAMLGLVSLRQAVPSLTVRRASAAIAAGMLVVALVTVTAAATSTWMPYQGYLLACRGDRTTCFEHADKTVRRIAAEHAGAAVTHLEMMANGTFQVCWTAPVASDRGCWFTTQYGGGPP